MIRRPPRSTLFPTRRSSDLVVFPIVWPVLYTLIAFSGWRVWRRASSPERSEEHTSELQSLTNLVCRLLLEKKKTKKYSKENNYNRKDRVCVVRILVQKDADS